MQCARILICSPFFLFNHKGVSRDWRHRIVGESSWSCRPVCCSLELHFARTTPVVPRRRLDWLRQIRSDLVDHDLCRFHVQWTYPGHLG